MMAKFTRSALLVALAFAEAGCSSDGAGASASGTMSADLPVASAESAGYSSTQLAALQPYLASVHSPAGMVLVGGKVIFTWGDVTAKMEIHSVRKSLLSSLYGSALGSGQISLSSTLASLGIDDAAPPLTAEQLTATVQDLLESRSGIYHDANYAPAMQEEDRPAPPWPAPGTAWFYNNWDFNAAGAVYEQQTHQSIYEAFQTEIAAPIGMQDYSPADGRYEWDTPAGQVYLPTDDSNATPANAISVLPAYTFTMSTRDLARFGLLYLQGGSWSGDQVVPADWVTASTQSDSQVTSLWNEPPGEGYGDLWWVGAGTGFCWNVDVGAGAFRAEGTGGHYVVVLPAYDMVVVNRADDAYYDEDPSSHDIGNHVLGKILAGILGAKL